jgi:hypothetical protein
MVVLLAAPLACRKHAKPSEAYVEAQTRFGKLYAAQGDNAFESPELAPIEELLGQVPADSLDAAAANALRQRIAEGKQRMLAQQKAREEALAKAQEPTMSTSSGFGDSDRGSPPPAKEPEPEDAGTDGGTGGGPGVGTSVADLTSGFSGCFRKGEALQVQGRGLRERWELADSAACRQQYPSLQEQVMLIEDGKVLGMAPKSAIFATSADGGTRGPDAGR